MNFAVRRTIPVLTLAMLAAVSACSRADNVAGRQGQAVPVLVAKVEKKTLPRTQSSIGTVRTKRSVAIKPQVDGIIQKIHITEGALVEAGQCLVTIDPRPALNALQIAKAELATAKAELAKAQADSDRYARLKSSQGVSEELYAQYFTKRDTCAALVQAKEASVANAELTLGYTEIKAPFPGHAGQINLREGSVVKANDSGSLLLTINQVSPIEVSYTVPEQVLASIRAAATAGRVSVSVQTQDNAPETVEGTLVFIDNNVDNTTGTVLLKAEFANRDESLWPGQFVKVTTVTGADVDALLVPLAAVQTGQQGSQCFVLKPDKTVELRHIRVARTQDGMAMIAEGLTEGETIITDGQLRLESGSLVSVRQTTAEAAQRP